VVIELSSPLPSFQLQRMQIKEGSFWAVANEDAFASADFFGELEKTFAHFL